MDIVIDSKDLAAASFQGRGYSRNMLRSLLELGADHSFRFLGWPRQALGSVEQFLAPLSWEAKARLSSPRRSSGPGLLYNPVGVPARTLTELDGSEPETPLVRVSTVLEEAPAAEPSDDSAVVALTRSAAARLNLRRRHPAPSALWVPPGLIQEQTAPLAPQTIAVPPEDYVLAEGIAVRSSAAAARSWWRILRAFQALSRRVTRRPRLIFLNGAPLPLRQAAALLGLTRDVSWVQVENLPESARERLLASAMAFVHAPRPDESWLWAAQAMRRGVPLIVPRTPFAEDLWGDAGLYYCGLDPLEITRALEQLRTSPPLRRLFAQRGITRAQAFTWEASARQLLDGFRLLGA